MKTSHLGNLSRNIQLGNPGYCCHSPNYVLCQALPILSRLCIPRVVGIHRRRHCLINLFTSRRARARPCSSGTRATACMQVYTLRVQGYTILRGASAVATRGNRPSPHSAHPLPSRRALGRLSARIAAQGVCGFGWVASRLAELDQRNFSEVDSQAARSLFSCACLPDGGGIFSKDLLVSLFCVAALEYTKTHVLGGRWHGIRMY